jgi:RNAse (barnase) inhibitor barstar
MTGDEDVMTSIHAPWVHEVDSVPQTAISTVTQSHGLVVQLDAVRIATLEELFREYVREFQLPEYFGWNWPAFYECMRDLSWLPATSYLTVIFNSTALLRAEPAELPTFTRQLADIGKRWANSFGLGPEWNGGEVPFNTILVQNAPA